MSDERGATSGERAAASPVPRAPSPTGIPATAGRLWAVALLTFKEAVRRKVFVVVLIFAAALVASAPFLPTLTPESRLRLIEIWSVRAAFLFSIILAIFLAGFSITGDVETRRIYTLVTKPIHKVTLFLGKFLGFTMMIGAFLGLTGAISLIYLRTIATFSPDFPSPIARSRFLPVATLPTGDADISPEGGLVRAVGGRAGAIQWIFTGLSRDRFDGSVRASLKVDLSRAEGYALETEMTMRVVNPDTGARREFPLATRTNQTRPFEFPSAFIGDSGALQIELAPVEPGMIIIARPERFDPGSPTQVRSLALYGRPESFEWNYFKGLLLVLFQSMVVLAMTLAATTVLSAPISILLGIFILLIGGSWSFLAESIEDVDNSLRNFQQAHSGQDGHGHDHGSDLAAPPWMMRVSSTVSKVVLGLIPNFDTFSMSDYLLKDLAVMNRDLREGFLAVFPRVAVLLLAGMIAMARRDFAT